MIKLFSIIFIIISVVANGQSLKTLSIEKQIEDIEYIKNELQELHPGIYSFQSEQEFEAGFESLKNNLEPNQTVFQFYNSIVPIINQIGCGHTTSKIPPKKLKQTKKNRKFLPVQIKILNDKIYITNILIENIDLNPGNEIFSIDGENSSDFIKTNVNRYPSDGRIMSRKYQSMEKNFAIDYSLFNYISDSFRIDVKQNDEINQYTLTGITYQDFISKTRLSKLDDLELQIIESISTAIITVRNSLSRKVFNTFLGNCFEQIRTNKIKYLIIDVRFDSFNRDSDGAELFSYITNEPFSYYKKLEVTKNYDVPKAIRWFSHYPIEQDNTGKYYWKIHPQLEVQSPKSNAFSGKVYVLTNGFTFSATSEFSSVVKSTKRGLIIGLETGGSYYGNNSGGMLRKALPNSGIIVYIPPIHYIMAVKDLGNYSRGVIPDIPVAESINDIVLNKDVIKEAALKVIQSEILKARK